VQLITLFPPNRYPGANVRQIFQRQPTPGVFGTLDQFLADTVVHIMGKPAFTPAHLLQQTFGRLCAFGLQLFAQAPIAMAHVQQVLSAVHCALAITRDVLDTHVNAEIIFNINLRIGLHIAGGIQKPFAFAIDKITLATLPGQQRLMVGPAHKGNVQAVRNRPDRHTALVEIPAQIVVIERDASMRLELALRCAHFVRIADLSDTADSDLCAQLVVLANVGVNQFMQWNTTKGLVIPGSFADPIASRIRLLKGCEKVLGLFRGRDKAHDSSEFHAYIVLHLFCIVNT
jgi:hypothetical protein